MPVASAAPPSVLRLETPRAFAPLLSPNRYKGAFGGRASAKSWFFAGYLLQRAIQQPGFRAVCIREVQLSLVQSVKRLLEDLIRKYQVSSLFHVTNTHLVTPGDGVIIFQGMSQATEESIKSLEGFDVAWVEEAQALSQRSLDLLRPTIRRQRSELWFSWNPRFPSDPVDALFRKPVKNPSNLTRYITVRVSYKDNPWLSEEIQREIAWDQERDPEKYAHIWLGEYERHAESRVFRNWRIEAFESPSDAAFLFGGDWGYAIDPTVLVRGFIRPQEPRRLYIDQEAYRVGCEIDQTPALFDTIEQGMARAWAIVTDSARPDTISYMQRHGYPRVTGAKKGPKSIEDGIEFLKSYDLIVHPRCQHVIDELTLYSFKTHPLTGEIIPQLQDKDNHVIDSLRYMTEPIRNPAVDFITW